MSVDLVVVGLGLLTPLGRGAEAHAFLARAGAGPFAPGGFVTEQGDGIAVLACPWIPLGVPRAERIGSLAAEAVAAACEPLMGCEPTARVRAWAVAPSADDPPVRGALRGALRARDSDPVERSGGGEIFRALEEARAVLDRGETEVALICTADSLVDLEHVAEHRSLAQNPWGPNLLEPSEGAVAIAVSTARTAAKLGLDAWARLAHVEAHRDAAHDSNDEPITATALTRVFRALGSRAGAPLRTAFGPTRVDGLRRREWDVAQARTASMWDPALSIGCADQEIGHVGELSPAANLALLLACLRHGAMPDPAEPPPPPEAPALAWGIDRAGLRAGALVVANVPRRGRELSARQANHTARPVRLVPNAPVARERASGPPRQGEDAARAERSPSPDGLPADPRLPTEDAADGAVRFDPEAHSPLGDEDVAESQLADCLDRMAMLARHRMERPVAELGEATARLLAQLDALAVIGISPSRLLDSVEAADANPWLTAAAALVLATLELPNGEQALGELAALVPDSDDAIRATGSALSWAPLSDPSERVRALLSGGSSAERALGLELGGRLRLLTAAELEPWLARGGLAELGAAARACALMPPGHASAEVRSALHGRLREVGRGDPSEAARARAAYECARALLLLGDRTPLDWLRADRDGAYALGHHAARLIALGGNLDDIAVLEPLLARLPATELALESVAALGHPGSWAYLGHFLDDPELTDVADRALRMLFGPIGPDREPVTREAWTRAIASGSFASDERIRWGARWSPAALIAYGSSGQPSPAEIALLVDELRVAGASVPEPLAELARLF